MNTDRLGFLESVARNSPTLQVVFLNHTGTPTSLLTGISSIDLLADKNTTRNFINFCLSHPSVREVIITPKFRRTDITVELQDHSEVKFTLIRTMIRRALNCLNITSIKNDAFVNDHGMLVASHHHQFDYIVLVNQYAQHIMPDRYKNYFSAFEPSTRTKIFRFVQPKYDLVINTLDELYSPSSSMLLKITVGLRSNKDNSLLLMIWRFIEYSLFNFFGFITKRNKHKFPLLLNKTGNHQKSKKKIYKAMI